MYKQVKPIHVRTIEKELKKLRKDLSDLPYWKEEKQLIEKQINAYGSINYNEIGYKSGGSTYSLDDLLESDRVKVNILESKINHTEYRYSRMQIHINKLQKIEQGIINCKYFDMLDQREVSFEKIAKIVKYSRMHVKRLHDSALIKLAHDKYESLEIA